MQMVAVESGALYFNNAVPVSWKLYRYGWCRCSVLKIKVILAVPSFSPSYPAAGGGGGGMRGDLSFPGGSVR